MFIAKEGFDLSDLVAFTQASSPHLHSLLCNVAFAAGHPARSMKFRVRMMLVRGPSAPVECVCTRQAFAVFIAQPCPALGCRC